VTYLTERCRIVFFPLPASPKRAMSKSATHFAGQQEKGIDEAANNIIQRFGAFFTPNNGGCCL
jgi:hypothetical protein